MNESITLQQVKDLVKKIGYDWSEQETQRFFNYNLMHGRIEGWEYAARRWEENRKKHSILR